MYSRFATNAKSAGNAIQQGYWRIPVELIKDRWDDREISEDISLHLKVCSSECHHYLRLPRASSLQSRVVNALAQHGQQRVSVRPRISESKPVFSLCSTAPDTAYLSPSSQYTQPFERSA
jgi:hypothetical protein